MKYIDLIKFKGYSLTLWCPEDRPLIPYKKWLNEVKRNLKLILPSRKLYQYGTLGLVYFDDRTTKEKINDWLCDNIFDRPKDYRPKHGIANLYRFMSFYDTTNGRKISSMDEIRDLERSGQVMLSHREAQQETKRAMKRREEQFNKKSKELFLNRLIEVEKGRKYSTEFRDRQEIDMPVMNR